MCIKRKRTKAMCTAFISNLFDKVWCIIVDYVNSSYISRAKKKDKY